MKPEFIIGKRMSGKTTSLIKKSSDTGGIIVCPSHFMIRNVVLTALTINHPIPNPMTYEEVLRPGRKKDNMYYFDEYGIKLEHDIVKYLGALERNRFDTLIVDQESIDSINKLLDSLNISDMSGKKLKVTIEISERGE